MNINYLPLQWSYRHVAIFKKWFIIKKITEQVKERENKSRARGKQEEPPQKDIFFNPTFEKKC